MYSKNIDFHVLWWARQHAWKDSLGCCGGRRHEKELQEAVKAVEDPLLSPISAESQRGTATDSRTSQWAPATHHKSLGQLSEPKKGANWYQATDKPAPPTFQDFRRLIAPLQLQIVEFTKHGMEKAQLNMFENVITNNPKRDRCWGKNAFYQCSITH